MANRTAVAFDKPNTYNGTLPNIVSLTFEVMRDYPFSTPLHEFGLAVTFFFPALALVTVVLRIMARRMTKSYGIDDTLMILALIVSILGTVPMYIYMKVGFQGLDPKERPKMPYSHYTGPSFLCIWLIQIFFPTTVYLVKASFICYMTPLGSSKRGYTCTCHTLLAITVACLLTTLGGTIFQCTPVERLWYRTIPGTTIVYAPFAMTMNSMNIVTDFAALCLPIWIFKSLRYHLRAKIALIVVFSMGLLVTAVSFVRLYFLYKIFYAPAMAEVSIATLAYPIEACLAIITASLPPLWPLARKWFPKTFARLGISRPYQQDELREITQVTYVGEEGRLTEKPKKQSALFRFFGLRKSGSTAQLTTKERHAQSWPSQSSALGPSSSRGGTSEHEIAVLPVEPLTKRNTDIMMQFEEQRQQSNEHYRRIWGGGGTPESADPYHQHIRETARTDKFGV